MAENSTKKKSKKNDLTPKQEHFCHEYLIDLNATQAAIRAGYSPKSAGSIGEEILKKPEIQNFISQLQGKRVNAVRIDAEAILKELYDLAMVDITQAYDSAGWLKPLEEIPENVRKAISYLEVNELFDGSGPEKHIIGVNRKIKFYDKPKSLELLGKHLKLFTERHELTGKDGGAIEHKHLYDLTESELDQRIQEIIENKGGVQ